MGTDKTNGGHQHNPSSLVQDVTSSARMWLYVEDSIIIRANQGVTSLIGKQSSEVVGEPLLSIIYPVDRARITSTLAEQLPNSGDETSLRARLLINDQDAYTVDIHATAISVDSPIAYSLSIVPVVEEPNIDVSASTLETLYRNVLELSPYGIALVNTYGTVISVNPAFAKLTGYPVDAIEGKHIAKLPTIRLRDIPGYLALFQKLLHAGAQNEEIEFRWKHRDGSIRWGFAYASIVRVDGQIKGLLTILHDITETKRHEVLLTAMNQAASAMLNAIEPADIYDEVSRVFTDLDYKFTVFVSDDQHQYISLRYYNFASRAIKAVENTLSIRLSDMRLPIERVHAFQEVIWNQRPTYVDDMDEQAMRLFDSLSRTVSTHLIRLLGVPKSINAPVTLEGGTLGILSIQSDDLRPEDVPALTVLANQMSAALRQAELYQRANTELAIRKQAETEVDRLQVMMHSISVSMPAMFFATDQNGIVLLWNKAIADATNIPAERAIGSRFWDVAPYLVVSREVFEEVVRTRKPLDRRRLSSGASGRHISILGFPFDTGEFTGVALYLDDVTETVAMENAMRQNAKLASIGGLAAGVAHEINNPLAAMMQAAQLVQLSLDTSNERIRTLMEQFELDVERVQQYLDSRDIGLYLQGIRDTGQRAAKIVSDLLSFSRKRDFTLDEHSLNDVILQAIDLVRTDLGSSMNRSYKMIDIQLHLVDNSPTIYCDSQQIQQVVINICRNAIQAMHEVVTEESSYEPELLIQTSVLPEFVQIVVQDNGPGIPEDVRAHLFEPFFTTKEVGEGTGLGLWLCWSIVTEHHQGTIYVDDDYVDGTRFVIKLPRNHALD